MLKNIPKDLQKYNFWQNLAAVPEVNKIVLHGSWAKKSNKKRSDIDLAIETSGPWQKVQDVIDDADTLLKIDAVNIDDLGDTEELSKQILACGVIVYEKKL